MHKEYCRVIVMHKEVCMKMSVKKLAGLLFAVSCFAPFGVFARGTAETADQKGGAVTKPYDIAVIIKATDSDFWQYLLVGAKNYGVEHPDLVKITTYGPPSEADIDKQVTILENVISTKPAAIVISSISSDATVPALVSAYNQGIKIITVDNKVKTDKIHSFLATNNVQGGNLAAQNMMDFMKKHGIDPKGKKIGVVSAMAGVQVLIDRDSGFLSQMKSLAPDADFVEIRYVDNDISKAMTVTEDMVTTYGKDLVGIFADNNHCSDGVSRCIGEQGLNDKVMVVGFDSDAEEINAIKAGSLKAICVQDPYTMGYKGVDFAVQAIEGKPIPKDVDTGIVVVTKSNIDNSDIKGKLDPFTLKKY
jgi:ribose transport system substrate-binding protein